MKYMPWSMDNTRIKIIIMATTLLALITLFKLTLTMDTVKIYTQRMEPVFHPLRWVRGEAGGDMVECNTTDPDYHRLMEDLCIRRNPKLRLPQVNDCTCPPGHLTCRKDIKLTLKSVSMETVVDAHPLVRPGGIYHPTCNPIQRVAIIMPVRDRAEHLAILLHHIHPFLQRQLISYQIIVSEQTAMGKFNKGLVMNAAFLEVSVRFGPFDCYIFHDVDMLPEDDRNIYGCTENIRHIGSHISKFAYKLIYEGLFGGVISLTDKQFRKVNGFSNNYAGWGGEDDDMYRRVRSRHLPVIRHPGIAYYYMLKHDQDMGNPSNHRADVWKQLSAADYAREGLSTATYRLDSVEKLALYTRLLINVERDEASGT